MATADLFVRLGLLSDGYVQGIRSAKEATARFEQAISGAKAALGKIAAVVGVAGGAYEAFNRTMQASQTTADAYDVAIAGAKAATESFFQTIATGDWSNFIDNIKEAIKYGREYQEMLDVIGDKQDSFDYSKSATRIIIAKARDIINDPSTTKEQKIKALREAEEEINKLKAISGGLAEDIKRAIVAHVNATTGEIVTEQDVDNFYRNKLSGLDKAYTAYKEKAEAVEKEIAELESSITFRPVASPSPYTKTVWKQDEETRERLKKRLQSLKEYYTQLKAINKENERDRRIEVAFTDQERRIGVDLREKQAGAEEFSYTQSAALSKLRKKVYGGEGTTATKATLTEIQKIDKAINDLRNKLHKLPETATDKIKDIQGKIKELEGKKLRLDVISKVNPEELTRQIASDVRPYEVPIVVAAASIDKIRKQIERIDAKLKLTTDAKEIQKLQAERAKLIKDSDAIKGNFGLKVPEGALKQYKAEAESTIDTNQDLVNSFNAISNAISTISGDAESGAAAFFRWGASVASAIGTAVPAITALTTAKKAEATANTAAAATGAASSVASVPFAGPVMAVAAIASVLAAITNLPKFATGGIVGGNSYSGDKILARLNSGEMVLNHRQISTLGGILANEGKTQGGKVEFVIRGQELVGILDKHSRRQSRT